MAGGGQTERNEGRNTADCLREWGTYRRPPTPPFGLWLVSVPMRHPAATPFVDRALLPSAEASTSASLRPTSLQRVRARGCRR